ncbi:MAG: pyridoxamine 5'-phosphate oxidase [Wenzhouxiangellaceae bacterium]
MRMNDEILDRFQEGLDAAVAAGLPEPNAMLLATSSTDARPGARVVLLKSHDADGFVFYTNLGSRKARELAENPRACLVFWWRELARQVIIDGVVRPVSDAEADAYFATRPRGSQIGAWASMQSTPLPSREVFMARIREFEQRFEGRDVPRPPYWSGFRVEAERVEFWYGREYRWHERIEYRAGDDGWQRSMLYP